MELSPTVVLIKILRKKITVVWFDSVFETPFARSLEQTGKNTLIGTLLLNIDRLSVKNNLEQLVNTEKTESF